MLIAPHVVFITLSAVAILRMQAEAKPVVPGVVAIIREVERVSYDLRLM